MHNGGQERGKKEGEEIEASKSEEPQYGELLPEELCQSGVLCALAFQSL